MPFRTIAGANAKLIGAFIMLDTGGKSGATELNLSERHILIVTLMPMLHCIISPSDKCGRRTIMMLLPNIGDNSTERKRFYASS